MSQFILYKTEDGRDRIELRLEHETAWLSLNQLAALFERDKSVISRHVANILDDGELDANSVVANFATTAAELIVERSDPNELERLTCAQG